MTYKSTTCDIRLVFVLLCGAGVILPSCNARCDITDVSRCLTIFGSNDINTFRCSQSGKTCIDNLRRTCVNSQAYGVISKVANLADYLCSTQGQNDLAKYTECLTALNPTSTNAFTTRLQRCATNLQNQIGSGSSARIVCSASRGFETCIVSAFNNVCQDTAARRFFARFADLVDVAGCFTIGGAASISYITKLSMAVWAGILTIFFI